MSSYASSDSTHKSRSRAMAAKRSMSAPVREGRSYSYRLTEKGRKVAALFVLFQKRVCGPLANSLFHHRPTKTATLPANIEAAYDKADEAIQHVIHLLAA